MFSPAASVNRRRNKRFRNFVLCGLAVCAFYYTTIWDGSGTRGRIECGPRSRSRKRRQLHIDQMPRHNYRHQQHQQQQHQQHQNEQRRQLAYYDTKPQKARPYGRDPIDPNYQSLLHPSLIDSSLFRVSKKPGDIYDKGYADDESACDNVLLFLPQSFARTGHGSQLNNYILAATIATFLNRAMIVLEAPPPLNEFMSNSQFGCPPEAWETVMVRTGAPPKRVGWRMDFPLGLSRLVKHPAWLSRQCPMPCTKTYQYEQWDELRKANNITTTPVPEEITCTNENGRETNIIVMGGRQVRDYFQHHYKEQIRDRASPSNLGDAASLTSLKMNYEWALRLGAAPHEARIFSGLQDRHEIWDYASAFMGRSGILRFQPWIARDVERYMKEELSQFPLNVEYDAIHVRRGDKLEKDGRHFVMKYWRQMDECGGGNNNNNNEEGDEEREEMEVDTGMGEQIASSISSSSRNYIPFLHYLNQYEEVQCKEDGSPRLVYVATDDPLEVQHEISLLPKDKAGNTVFRCHRFSFLFSPHDPSLGFHIDTGRPKDDCEERYARNIASIADLMISAKSDVFVGEYNSNWGRLVRMFRLKMNDGTGVNGGMGGLNGGTAEDVAKKPVLERETKIAWGFQHPGPPGW